MSNETTQNTKAVAVDNDDAVLAHQEGGQASQRSARKGNNNNNNAMIMVMNYDTPSKQPFQNNVSSEDNVTINLGCKRGTILLICKYHYLNIL